MGKATVTGSEYPFSELEKIVHQFRHIQGEHAHEGVDGSWRRRQGGSLAELAESFEQLLARWVKSPTEQAKWRAHLHDGAQMPEAEPFHPPLFAGVSETGSTLLIRASGSEYEVSIDGKPTARLPRRVELAHSFVQDGVEYTEVFEAPAAAMQALSEYLRQPAGAPPWQFAPELAADGLIDSTFALTDRGRRFWSRQRAA